MSHPRGVVLPTQHSGLAEPRIDPHSAVDDGEKRRPPVMRKFEVSSLAPDGGTRSTHHIAPATPLFEQMASAFARGTLIATPQGPIAVEDLLPGDMLVTQEFGPLELVWVGSTSLVPNAMDQSPQMARLTRVMADSFGLGKPMSDVMFGPAARILNGRPGLRELTGSAKVLTEVRDFADGMSVIDLAPPSPVRLYHLRLRHHATISAGGLWVETYHPGLNATRTMGQNMKSLFLSFFPDIETMSDFGALTYPRVSMEKLDSLAVA